jgi:two-component system, OmpR family, phosphate regulon sensor histidine kinase PhoR
MPSERIYLIISDAAACRLLENAILRPAGYEVVVFQDVNTAQDSINVNAPDLVILGDTSDENNCLECAEELLEQFPYLAIILMPGHYSEVLEINSYRLGVVDCLTLPVRTNEVLQAVKNGLKRRNRLQAWLQREFRRNTKTLQKKMEGLEAIQRAGRSVTASLDLESVLKAVVDAAVELTGSEEGSLLLLDETSGELYMQAARNFQEDFVRTFRLPIRDTLPGQVLRTGQPLLIDEKTPQKIKTAYLVNSLIYVPLKVNGRPIGILGVDNRHSRHQFSEQDVNLVTALAEYAAIAVANARIYTRTTLELKKLEKVLVCVEDGIIIIDEEIRIILVNQMARMAFQMGEEDLTGKQVKDVLKHPELVEFIVEENRRNPCRTEIKLEDGRIFNTQLTSIPDIGVAVTMQDITHLKELDRIKSDFVSTVSHDLRSPLTAILGYVELIGRAGPVNENQREFIRRVQFSVNNITSLINDLLDLGRIEAGFDAQKEIVPISAIIRYALEGMRSRVDEKQLKLIIDAPDTLPHVLGNPVRLRQMVTNILGNSIKYNSTGGFVKVKCWREADQIILRITDNGPGIPAVDQPYIFDKFYRGGNVPSDVPGTGLGLAIVKTIVENHQGRIWVNSVIGQGTSFTVVLPVAEEGSS